MTTTAQQPTSSLIDTLLGNRNGTTVQIEKDKLALQLAGSGFIPGEMVYAQTWLTLMSMAGARNGAGGEVIETDTGMHQDATANGYNGAVVPNAGRYIYSSAWARWVRIGSSGLASVIAALDSKVSGGVYETTDESDEWVFTDEIGRVLFTSSDLKNAGARGEIYETTDISADVIFIDETGRIIASIGGKSASEEIVAARGNKASLQARLDVSTDSDGFPIDYIWGAWNLRETRMRLRQLKRAEASQFAIAIFGDSWSQAAARWSGPVADALVADYGTYGSGWIGWAYPEGSSFLRNGNVRPAVYPISAASGTWVGTYNTAPTADLGYLTSSTAGSRVSASGPTEDTTFALHYVGTADGVVRYRWNGGAWSGNLNVQGADVQTAVALTGKPAGAWALDVEVVSGTVKLCGLVASRSGNGVIVHKLAGTGSQTFNWASQDETKWKAGYGALGPVQLAIMMWGTNDQPFIPPADYKTNLLTMIDRHRAVNPMSDVLLVAPCENQRTTNPRPMSEYARVMREAAVERKCAFLNLQYVFGDDAADYAFGSARPWFASDLIHPDPATGGRAIADAVLHLLTQQ
ncbi:SGNH/GDSL hydrolase family protein [Rhizobium sp. YAF28]|uniref:SGNH/GDSL hydrolase family protein n=1 Tax=Rhizobium sp. YAF28 TaxID=3233081 RepID=UPI003F957368